MPNVVASLGARLAASFAHLVARRPPPAEIKSSRAGPLIAFEHLHQPVWSPRDYAAFANEGFMQNPVVYRCVRMIAECAAHIPLLLYAGAQEIDEHPLLSLLRRPNAHETWPDFMQKLVGFLLVSGNAYIEAVALEGEVRELHLLRPDRVKVVAGADGWPEAFDYSVGGRTVRIGGEVTDGVRTVLHVKLFHPANDHYGLSPLEAAASAIDLHNTAARWNKALLDNSARPSGAIVYTARDGNLTGDQIERLKSELEAGFQGVANAGRPLLLEGGLDWKAMSLSPKDMDFIEARHAAAREIALALGVPPMLLGIPGDNTYSNLAEAQRTFWRATVLPLVERVANQLAHWLAPAYAPAAGGRPSVYHQFAPLTLVPDLDTLPALAPEREALWAALEKTSFLTTQEKRALAGFSPAPRADAKWASEAPQASADAQRASEARLESLKFNPGQPRSAGRPDAGRWTDGSGGTGRDVLLIARRPGGGKRPSQTQPPSSSEQPRHKKPKAGQSGKEGATDVPDWVRQSGDRPLLGEDGRDFAKRVLDRKYPENKGRYEVGPKSEFNQIKKWADRHFE